MMQTVLRNFFSMLEVRGHACICSCCSSGVFSKCLFSMLKVKRVQLLQLCCSSVATVSFSMPLGMLVVEGAQLLQLLALRGMGRLQQQLPGSPLHVCCAV
jgi:hypothetical protein